MCDIASILGGMISIAGSAMQAQQQAAFVNAQNDANKQAYELSRQARMDELARQQRMERDAASYWDRATEDMTADAYKADKDESVDKFLENYDDMASAFAGEEGQLLSGQRFTNETMQQEIAARTAGAAQDARERVKALAALSSYGNVDLNRSQTMGDTANWLSTLNNIRRGSLGVSGFEQNISPAQIYQGGSGMGDILSGAGSIVSGYGGRTSRSPAAMAAFNAGRAGLY